LILAVYIAFVILSSSYFIPQTSGIKAILLGVIISWFLNGVKKAFLSQSKEAALPVGFE